MTTIKTTAKSLRGKPDSEMTYEEMLQVDEEVEATLVAEAAATYNAYIAARAAAADAYRALCAVDKTDNAAAAYYAAVKAHRTAETAAVTADIARSAVRASEI
jgi:hypothetical protein